MALDSKTDFQLRVKQQRFTLEKENLMSNHKRRFGPDSVLLFNLIMHHPRREGGAAAVLLYGPVNQALK